MPYLLCSRYEITKLNGDYVQLINMGIEVQTVKIITYKGEEFERTATSWEIIKEERNGVAYRDEDDQWVFDFRHK